VEKYEKETQKVGNFKVKAIKRKVKGITEVKMARESKKDKNSE
jgi:hypothetical protein